MTPFPPVELTCPAPATCPVLTVLPEWTDVDLFGSNETWYRGYFTTWGYDEYNPGVGNARFSPIDSRAGRRVPSMYLAAEPGSALLESLLHSVDAVGGTAGPLAVPTFPERKLVGWALACVASPRPARLADLRDARLNAMGVRRSELITSSAEHYPCSRRIATAIHADPRDVAGIVWHSRQAEITGHGQVETVVLFGDRHPSGRGDWRLQDPGVRTLFEGPGRELVESVAANLGVVVD